MIDRSTNIRGALRQRQRGFILSPYRFSAGAPPNAWESLVASLSPTMWLRLSATSGAMLDASGNGHVGTVNGSVVRGEPAIYANMGLCARFQSTNQYVSVADAAALKVTGDVTFGLAFKRNGTQTGAFAKLGWKPTVYASGRCNYGLIYDKSTNKIFFRVNASSTYYDAQSTTTFADATSYLIFGRRLGSEVSIWVNGVKEGTATLPSSGTSLDTSTSAIYIGGQSSNANDQHNGWIDEVTLFGSGLSDTNLADLYAARA